MRPSLRREVAVSFCDNSQELTVSQIKPFTLVVPAELSTINLEEQARIARLLARKSLNAGVSRIDNLRARARDVVILRYLEILSGSFENGWLGRSGIIYSRGEGNPELKDFVNHYFSALVE